MYGKINYFWRLFATFLSFSLFGLGGLVMSVTIFPCLYLLPISNAQKVRLSRKAMRQSFRIFISFMKNTGVLTYEIDGVEKLQARNGQFIVANHPTLIDVVFLIAFSELPNCVIKKGVWNNPFMYFVVRSSGFIENSAHPEGLLERCVETLRAGEGLIIFPEGTRTPLDNDIKMNRFCAHIALRAEKNLTPVSITCEPITLSKQHSWYNIPRETKAHFCIRVQDDIEIKSFLDIKDAGSMSAKRLTEHMKKIFIKGMH